MVLAFLIKYGMVGSVIESMEEYGYMNVGDTYHGLKLLAYCGGGAFGEVFYCEDVTHKKMAVKIINKKHLDGQCLRELKGITNYRRIIENNPNLLQIDRVEEDEDTFYYTMEPADSLSNTEYKPDTLAARLSKGPIPDAEIYPMLSNIFQGIKALHTAGFAHRDIKPDNILFVKGIPKLADMGLLSSLSMTMSTIAGTFIFIPPEIRSSDNWDKYDSESRQSSDLYAFGKVIYCAVTGQSPENFPSLPENLQISAAVKILIQLSTKLCEKNPAKRLMSLNKIESVFAVVKRKIIYGDTWWEKQKDKIFNHYLMESSLTRKFLYWSLNHWLAALILLILLIALDIGLAYTVVPLSIKYLKNRQLIQEALTFTLPGNVKLELAKIPAGTFMMGSPNKEFKRFSDREQLHSVTITKDYWLSRFEITQQQYKSVMGTNPSKFQGERLPVEQVTWRNAETFCSRLNELCKKDIPKGYQFALPTEAEWEYACRATTATCLNNGKDFYSDSELEEVNEVAWYKYNSDMKTHEVGLKKPNLWGLYDMHGNVSEWCCEWSEQYNGTQIDPITVNSRYRSLRSGSYFNEPRHIRQAFRHPVSGTQDLFATGPGTGGNNGIRLALVPIRK